VKADIEFTIFGAGVIGLACARELASYKKEFYILEKENQFGTGISSRNSEVIHSGIYYNPDSLKTKLCIEGRNLLYRYCEDKKVSYKKTGKLIVATDESEIPKLKTLFENGKQNGVDGLYFWEESQIKKAEPDIQAVAAIYCRETGIIDTKELMNAYLSEAEEAGGALVCSKEPVQIKRNQTNWQILLSDGTEFTTEKIINACGLGAVKVIECIQDYPHDRIPEFRMAKGHYFSLTGTPKKFSHLIYPLPQVGGLGVHLTLDLAGEVRFGPDVHWVEKENYEVPESLRSVFHESVKRYLPWIEPENLQPGYAGIRPKLHGPNEKFADFKIQTEAEHGLKGLVNLLGIESPGITASLAIAKLVVENGFN
jgi:2-hydroxyglutarate dehydrogenase